MEEEEEARKEAIRAFKANKELAAAAAQVVEEK